jgi:hypothetical protein
MEAMDYYDDKWFIRCQAINFWAYSQSHHQDCAMITNEVFIQTCGARATTYRAIPIKNTKLQTKSLHSI